MPVIVASFPCVLGTKRGAESTLGLRALVFYRWIYCGASNFVRMLYMETAAGCVRGSLIPGPYTILKGADPDRGRGLGQSAPTCLSGTQGDRLPRRPSRLHHTER